MFWALVVFRKSDIIFLKLFYFMYIGVFPAWVSVYHKPKEVRRRCWIPLETAVSHPVDAGT